MTLSFRTHSNILVYTLLQKPPVLIWLWSQQISFSFCNLYLFICLFQFSEYWFFPPLPRSFLLEHWKMPFAPNVFIWLNLFFFFLLLLFQLWCVSPNPGLMVKVDAMYASEPCMPMQNVLKGSTRNSSQRNVTWLWNCQQ